jgi:hypothetical protein
MPWLYPPPDAVPVVAVSDAASIAPGATVTLLDVVTVPSGSVGIIRAFALTCDDFANIRVSLRVAGAPVRPIISISYPYGQLYHPQPIPGPGVWVQSGQSVDVTATNVGVAAITGVRARVEGYFWATGGRE